MTTVDLFKLMSEGPVLTDVDTGPYTAVDRVIDSIKSYRPNRQSLLADTASKPMTASEFDMIMHEVGGDAYSMEDRVLTEMRDIDDDLVDIEGLEDGSDPTTLRHNIRKEIQAGMPPGQAVAIAYDKARMSALERGNMARYNALVGADPVLPRDVAAMTELQALAELQRLDNIQASRGLSPQEFQRLMAVELRLEQFVPDLENVKAQAAEYERRAAEGEDVFKEAEARYAAEQARKAGTLQTVDAGTISSFGSRNPLPWLAALAAVIIVTKKRKR